jgi:hypothetical protein
MRYSSRRHRREVWTSSSGPEASSTVGCSPLTYRGLWPSGKLEVSKKDSKKERLRMYPERKSSWSRLTCDFHGSSRQEKVLEYMIPAKQTSGSHGEPESL